MIEKNTVILDLKEYEKLRSFKDDYENLVHNMIAIDKNGQTIEYGDNIFSPIVQYEISVNDLKKYLHIKNSKLIVK